MPSLADCGCGCVGRGRPAPTPQVSGTRTGNATSHTWPWARLILRLPVFTQLSPGDPAPQRDEGGNHRGTGGIWGTGDSNSLDREAASYASGAGGWGWGVRHGLGEPTQRPQRAPRSQLPDSSAQVTAPLQAQEAASEGGCWLLRPATPTGHSSTQALAPHTQKTFTAICVPNTVAPTCDTSSALTPAVWVGH